MLIIVTILAFITVDLKINSTIIESYLFADTNMPLRQSQNNFYKDKPNHG